jgi:hypothetical protein
VLGHGHDQFRAKSRQRPLIPCDYGQRSRALRLCAANQQTTATGMSPQEQQDRSVCLQHAHKDSGYYEKAFASCMAAKGYKKDNLYPSETTADAERPSLSDTLKDTWKKLTQSASPDPVNSARAPDGENTGQDDQSSSH